MDTRRVAPRVIRLGRWQRGLIARCLGTPSRTCYPSGKREAEAVRLLVARRILVPAPALPGAYRIASEHLGVHLKGTLLQHGKGTP